IVETVLGVTRDITELKRAEDAFRVSEEKYRSLVESTEDSIYLVDRNCAYLFMNKKHLSRFGRPVDKIVGREYGDFHSAEETKEFTKRVKEVFETGKSISYEYRSERDRGYFLRTLSPVKKPDGKITNVTVISKNITERKQAEEALRDSRNMLQIVLDSIPAAVFWKDRNSNYLGGNLTWLEAAGLKSSEQVVGKSDYELPWEKGQTNSFREDDKMVMESGIPKYGLIEPYLRADGTRAWAKTNKVPLRDKQGNVTGILGTYEDITERKRLEEELLRAQKIESVGLLAGGIAHDFNNILTTILGNVSMAKMQVTPEGETFEMLSEAEKASIRAQTLTKQLLTFAKGGAPVKETASIKDIFKELPSFMLRGSKSSCKLSIAEDLWPVEVDVGQISQVVSNIIINAHQAMPEGGIIQVAAENLIIEDRHGLPVKPGRYIKTSITDQGVGIPEKHLSNLFDPYFTTKQERNGLGLATTYSIIKKHDGHIRVESTLGEGTTFHIYLSASEKVVPEKEEVRLIKGQGRILVMDDEASLKKIAGRMLDKLGYESEFAKDGAEAIKMYKEAQESEKPYDAVILDLTIPGGMGGKEAINKLLEINPEVKAIVSSGYSDDPVLANFQEYGFKSMMPKPFESQSLSQVLYEVLKGKKE
ncbi:PAS domain S-box protein, partial [Thermodesulfobacteriota bacterium]